jgi:hypothetical protein
MPGRLRAERLPAWQAAGALPAGTESLVRGWKVVLPGAVPTLLRVQEPRQSELKQSEPKRDSSSVPVQLAIPEQLRRAVEPALSLALESAAWPVLESSVRAAPGSGQPDG